MLFPQQPLRKCNFSIVVKNRYGALGNDRASIQRVVNQVDRASRPLHTVCDRLLLRVESGERGQQAGMNVQDALRKRFHKILRQQSHVACEANDINLLVAERGKDTVLMLVSCESPAGNDLGFEITQARRFDTGCVRLVAYDNGDFRIRNYAFLYRICERNHVRSATGDENGDPFHRNCGLRIADCGFRVTKRLS
jgi:hypothetical protein